MNKYEKPAINKINLLINEQVLSYCKVGSANYDSNCYTYDYPGGWVQTKELYG